MEEEYELSPALATLDKVIAKNVPVVVVSKTLIDDMLNHLKGFQYRVPGLETIKSIGIYKYWHHYNNEGGMKPDPAILRLACVKVRFLLQERQKLREALDAQTD